MAHAQRWWAHQRPKCNLTVWHVSRRKCNIAFLGGKPQKMQITFPDAPPLVRGGGSLSMLKCLQLCICPMITNDYQ